MQVLAALLRLLCALADVLVDLMVKKYGPDGRAEARGEDPRAKKPGGSKKPKPEGGNPSSGSNEKQV